MFRFLLMQTKIHMYNTTFYLTCNKTNFGPPFHVRSKDVTCNILNYILIISITTLNALYLTTNIITILLS